MGILNGKVAIVTGASEYMGRSEAIALAKEGASVVVAARNYEKLVKVVGQIESIGGKALAVRCDVSNREQVKNAVAETVKAFGTVDILVNNAHYKGWRMVPLHEWTEEELRLNIEVGYYGSWYFMMECFPIMKEQGGGKIINTVSGCGFASSGYEGFAGYAASKEAIRTLTRYAAREWGQYKINVNAISPAAIGKERFDEAKKLGTLDMGKEISPMKRIGDPEKDVAPAVVFLASSQSDWVTGDTICNDGGITQLV